MSKTEKLFSRLMKMYRASGDITQEELSKDVGVSRQTIINMERGHQGFNLETCAKISRRLGFKLGELDSSSEKHD